MTTDVRYLHSSLQRATPRQGRHEELVQELIYNVRGPSNQGVRIVKSTRMMPN